jgi:hypothetical protein
MRRGIGRLISFDAERAVIQRGQESHTVKCRVTYQTGAVWDKKQWDGGLTMDMTPFVLAFADADIKERDILTWRGRRFTVGKASFPSLDGGAVCLQAQLTEVRHG